MAYSTFTTPLISRNSCVWKNHQTISNGIQFKSNDIITNVEQNVTTNKLSWGDLFPQILASVVAFLLATQPGINMVYSNIFLNHYEFTDVSELSWLTSILVFCTPIGAITIGVIMDRIGRKNAFLLTSGTLLISWSIASVARPENMRLIYACRFFAGIGGVGVLFATTVGSLFQWQTVNVIFFIFTAVTTVLLVIFLPESPVWLAKFRSARTYDARTSLRRIYPKNDQVFMEELDHLYRDSTTTADSPEVHQPQHCIGCEQATKRRRLKRCFWWRTPQPRTVTRPVRVLAIVFLLQQLSGCYPVIFYAVPVMRSVAGTTALGGPYSDMEAMVALGAVRLLTSVVACALSLHVGRRPLLIASSLAMACSAALVALTYSPTAAPLWPLIGVAVFACSGSAGVLVFPWTLVGELLPVSVRASAGASLVAYAYTLMFVVLKAFPYAVADDDGGSVATTFAAFAAGSLAMAAYVHARLPETMGKRFDEIEAHFADDKHAATATRNAHCKTSYLMTPP
ncbi:facilitated trehalose transporter Tret1 isoform X3 [Acyrthosiphon pisum]|uniref:Major facilitator superfamily (MFS) profile domain-containing protein n=1 Tax=Acyrthosiphon pisum TaxID=7029 RepID=A0A8R2D4W4_ACYPI|nr:facilitated trehalose transporter Tret1 isoform X3 [Acyrthosiphon pisum]|eukprot:XP_016660677.1 PREDICTED: facilitated trehalose transporter Tret1 isoform X3 [Acyrthosiphon pisum]